MAAFQTGSDITEGSPSAGPAGVRPPGVFSEQRSLSRAETAEGRRRGRLGQLDRPRSSFQPEPVREDLGGHGPHAGLQVPEQV